MSQPRYSKRHYEDVAGIFRQLREELKDNLGRSKLQGEAIKLVVGIVEERFIEMFQADNKLFDAERFRKASA